MNKNIKLILAGAFAGVCNGLFGSGGGTLAVPCLEKFASLEEKKAHATAILVILPLSAVSFLTYSSKINVDFTAAATVVSGGVLGSTAGAFFLKKFSGTILRKIFGLFILVAALRMVTT